MQAPCFLVNCSKRINQQLLPAKAPAPAPPQISHCNYNLLVSQDARGDLSQERCLSDCEICFCLLMSCYRERRVRMDAMKRRALPENSRECASASSQGGSGFGKFGVGGFGFFWFEGICSSGLAVILLAA